MKRAISAVSLFILACAALASQTPVPLPVTGNLTSIIGSPVAYAGLDVQLQNCASPVAITGYWGIVQQEYQVQANASGMVSFNLWPNDLITCNSTTGNSQYLLSILVNGAVQGTPQCYQIVSTQGTWNINGPQQPIPCSQPPPNPQDASFRNINSTGFFQGVNGAMSGNWGAAIINATSSPYYEINGTGIFTLGMLGIPNGGMGADTSLGANENLGIPGPVINAAGYPNLDAAVNACNAQTTPILCYEIYVPATIAIANGPLTCNNYVRLVGQSTTASIVQVGAFDGVYNCTPEHINFQATSPSSGIGVRLSGLSQAAVDVQFSSTNPGTNKFSTGLESYGSVSDTVTGMYCETGSASTCAGLVSNGSDQTGNFTFLGGDLRGIVTGLYLNSVLSGSIHGGTIEDSGTQGVLAASNPFFFLYGTEFESNGTSDIYWPTGGYAQVQGAVFSGGTTNNFNCPNTTCGAQLDIDGAIGSVSGNWIIGNSIAKGSKFQNSFVGGTSFFTNNSAGLLSISEIATHDSTVISDTIGYNGDSVARQCLQPGSSGYPFCITADNAGNVTFESNGVSFMQSSGSANAKFFGIVNAITGFDVNGSPLVTSNLNDWTDAGVSAGYYPGWNAGTSKWTPTAPSITAGSPTLNQAACIKAVGPPVVIGYCSTVVSSGGACTCN